MECVLHIGTEKTGTKSIQEWLYANRDRLSAEGIALADTIGKPNNRKLAAFFQNTFDDFFTIRGIATPAAKARYFEGFLEALAREIDAVGRTHRCLVITSEHFHSRFTTEDEIAALKAFLAEHVERFRVLCYFREQSALRESLYSTALRGGETAPIERFQRDVMPGSHYYDYDLMLSKWERVFGAGALVPALYDRAAFAEGDLRKDFIRRIDAAIPLDGFEFAAAPSNERLSLAGAAALRALNEVLAERAKESLPSGLRERLVAFVEEAGSLKLGEISDPGRAEFFARFAESNRRFSRHFFGVDGNVFAPPLPAKAAAGSAGVAADAASAALVGALFRDLADGLFPSLLVTSDAAILRKTAVRIEAGKPVEPAAALALLRLVRRARPDSPHIQAKIEELEGKLAPSASPAAPGKS
jgi:hypothetical protein